MVLQGLTELNTNWTIKTLGMAPKIDEIVVHDARHVGSPHISNVVSYISSPLKRLNATKQSVTGEVQVPFAWHTLMVCRFSSHNYTHSVTIPYAMRLKQWELCSQHRCIQTQSAINVVEFFNT